MDLFLTLINETADIINTVGKLEGTSNSGVMRASSRDIIITGGTGLIGAILGGALSLVGTIISTNRQVKSHEKIQFEMFEKEAEINFQNKMRDKKYNLLENLMGNRVTLTNPEENITLNADSSLFFSALNSIGVVFADSDKVINKYNEYLISIGNSEYNSNHYLYLMISEIHKHLNLKPPERDSFYSPLTFDKST